MRGLKSWLHGLTPLNQAGTGADHDVILTGTNTYQGRSQIQDATVLVADAGAGLPAASTVRFYNGVWETSGTITRMIGNTDGESQIAFDDWGGFAAYGGGLTVSLTT